MSTYKFLHAADLHIDSPLRGLDKYDGAPVDEIRGATRAALENLVSLAIEEKVEFVILAGDIYDGTWPDHNTGLYFISQMTALKQAGINVYIVSGNHDAESKITKKLRYPDNVTVFPSKKPKTIKNDELEYSIHGQSFADSSVSENLAVGYPTPTKNHINIGILHTSVDGREGHANYAPCTLRDLTDKGYDYWALGHIHKREVLSEDPYVIFPGNIQGRHARETGKKGCTLVSVNDGNIVAIEHRDLDVLRWFGCEVDASGLSTRQEVLDEISLRIEKIVDDNPDMILALRVRLVGNSEAHYEIVRDKENFFNDCCAIGLGISNSIWVEKIEHKTTTVIESTGVAMDKEILSGIQERANQRADSEEALALLTEELSDFHKRLPPELLKLEGDDSLNDSVAIKRFIMDAKDLISSHLADGASQ
jgi:DNA repair exonuclease SbcCD nuclease subunit|tara:strand:+ start:487 stop:1752 length:1266 start_codon:yes stop_codon:yes gene_type:complete